MQIGSTKKRALNTKVGNKHRASLQISQRSVEEILRKDIFLTVPDQFTWYFQRLHVCDCVLQRSLRSWLDWVIL